MELRAALLPPSDARQNELAAVIGRAFRRLDTESPDDAAEAVVYALTQPAHLVLSDLTLQPESHQL